MVAFASLLLTGTISFLFTPFLINRFGTSRYGLLALGMSVVGFTTILDFGLLGTIRRFQSKATTAGDVSKVNSILGTSLRLYSPVGAVALIVIASSGYWMPRFVEIPQSLDSEFKVLMLALGAFMFAHFIRAAFAGLLFGANRVDLERLLRLSERIVLTVAAVALIVAWQGTLYASAVAILLAAAVGLWLAPTVSRRVVPGCKPDLAKNATLARAMVRFSSGVFLISSGAALVLYLPPILVGASLGTDAIAYFSVAILITSYLMQALQAISTPLFPVATRIDVRRDQAALAGFYIQSTRIVLLLAVCVSSAVAVYASDLVTLWIGEDFAQSGQVAAILLVGTVLQGSATPGRNVLIATRAVFGLGIAEVMTGLVTIASLGIMLGLTTWGLQGVAWILTIAAVLLGGVFLPLYASHQLGLPIIPTWAKIYLPSVGYGCLLVTATILVRNAIPPTTLVAVGIALGASVALGIAVGSLLTLSAAERKTVIRLATGSFSRSARSSPDQS